MNLIRLKEISLIVLPEMFLTGYSVDARAVAGRGGEALAKMQAMARDENCAVCGTAAVEEKAEEGGGAPRFYNRMFFVRPDGTFTKYDKRHLFSFAGEDKIYTPGRERVVVEWRGWRILLQTCYDLRFPVFSRQNADRHGDPKTDVQGADYDLIVYSADWPASRIDAWDVLLRARAIENLCYVVGVNAIHSGLIDYKGHSAQKIDLETLRDFRKKFPALEDSDDFALHF